MSRHWFGNALADWAFEILEDVDGHSNVPGLVIETEITFWNQKEGGTQLTDLLVDDEPADHVVTTGDGAIPEFQGPDGVWWMWADGGAGRYVIVAWDIGGFVAELMGETAANAAAIQGHVAAFNPHSTRVQDLADVDNELAAAVTDGQVLGYHAPSGLWLPHDVEGITGIVTVDTEQTITAHKLLRPTDPQDHALTLRPAVGQLADLLRVMLGEEGDVQVFGLTPEGALRITAPVGTTGLRVRRRAGQTARLVEVVDAADQPLAWLELDGRLRGPNQGFLLPYSHGGAVEVKTGAHRIYNDTGSALTIRNARASVATPPAGAAIIVDVNVNGTSIFTAVEEQPTIEDGTNTSGRVDAIGTAVVNPGAFITIDVDQIGSTSPGEDLTVQVLCY